MNYKFVCKVKYTKQNDNGSLARVTESYLVHESTFGSAEEAIYMHLGEIIRGEFAVEAIVRVEFAEIIQDDEFYEQFYEIKARFDTIDEDAGKEKKQTFTYLITAEDTKAAISQIETLLKDNPGLTIPNAKESPIIEVFEAMEAK